jgi:TP901 family phage tail tape measure protein
MAIQIPLNAQLQNATQLQQQIQNAVNSVQLNLGGGAGGSRALNSLSQPLGRLTGQADEFTKSLDAANARVLAFGASVGVLNVLSNAFKALVASTINVEKTLADINVVFNKSTSEIKGFGKELFTIAKDTGQSFNEVSKAALEFSRQGKTTEETLARTKDALILTRLTGLDTARAVEGLTATINSFSKEALTSSEIINKLAAVDQKFAVSSADLTEALSRSASVAQNAGVGFEELIGIVAALQERTARGGAVIGNSLKTIFTRVRDSDTLRELNSLGVAVEDINTGKLLSASDILKNLAKNAQAFGEVQKSDLFKDVGGGFQINQLIALLDDYSSAQSKAGEAQKVATGATNQAYVANEKLNQTISALINRSTEGLKELGATLGDLGIADSIKSALGAVNGFIEAVQGLMEGEGLGAKLAQGLVKGIGSVLSGPGLALFGVVISKLIIDLGRFAVQGLKTFLGIGKAASEQRALQEAIVITLSRNAALQTQINRFQGNAVAQASVLAGIYNQQEASLRRQNAIAAGMSSVLFRQGLRAGPQGFSQTGRAAGGYLPSAEASDVSRGVGGASPSAQVVSIPNFAFGNGQRGTMIANTSEYIVPNYANGGSAIFNQDMVSSMGLPAGAQKIRAAGGYVPNFAKAPVNVGGSKLGGKPYQVKTPVEINAGEIGVGMINISPKERKDKASLLGSQIPKVKANHPNYLDTTFNLVGLQISDGLQKFRKQSTEDADLAEFGQDLNKYITAPIVQFAADLFKNVPEMGIPKSSFLNDVQQELTKSNTSLLSKSAQGDIFEKSISLALMGFQDVSKESSIFTNSENSPFDFDPTGPASAQISKYFFGPKRIVKADAKRSNSSDARASFLKKMFNDDLTYNIIKGELSNYDENGKPIALNTNTPSSPPIKKASKGYIPNFANQALTDSINRERIESGLPISAISVTQDGRLMNNRNPMGLAVINSRDEPNGKIPNFAAPNPAPLTSADFNITQKASAALGNELDKLNQKIKDLTVEVSKGTKTEIEAKAALDKFVQGLTKPGTTKPLLSARAQQNVQDVAGRRLSESVAQNPAPLAKGFGDAVGKIFLFQTALSFATGAAGELTTSTGKLIAKFSEFATNIASFAVLGQQLLQSNPVSAFGKITKTLGLVGLAAGVVYEGFKLASFGIKEITGENDRASTALSRLQTAAEAASIRLDELNPEAQKDSQKRAAKGLEKVTEAWGDSVTPEINKQAANVAAQGITGDRLQALFGNELKSIVVENIAKNEDNMLFRYFPKGTSKEEMREKLPMGVVFSLAQATESAVSTALTNVLKLPEVQESGSKLASVREGLKVGAISTKLSAEEIAKQTFGENGYDDAKVKAIESFLQKQQIVSVNEQASLDRQNEVNLGKRVAVDIAKQEIENAIKLKKLEIERSGKVENSIKLRIATSQLSEREKIFLEDNLKSLELQKKLQSEILDIAKTGLDTALSANSINVNVKALEKMKDVLKDIDLSKFDSSKIDFATDFKDETLRGLQDRLVEVGNLKDPQQARTIIESLIKQAEALGVNYKKQEDINKSDRDHLLEINKANQALQNQLSIIDQIAKKAQSIATLNISLIDLDIARKQARVTTIDASLGNNNLSEGDKEALQAERIKLQKDINDFNNSKEEESLASKNAGVRGQIAAKREELKKLVEKVNAYNADPSEMDEETNEQNLKNIKRLRGEIANSRRELEVNVNAYEAAKIATDANTEALAIQEKQIGQVTGAYASLNKQLYDFRKGSGERIASADMGLLSATDPNALANSTIQRQVEMEAQAKGGKLNDKEYYAKIQKGTAIRQKQFELSVETSAVRRNELENEIKLMEEIGAISAATDDERLAKIKVIVDARNREGQSFGSGFERGVGALKDKTQRFRSEIGEQIPQLFSDNLAQGLNDAISGAKSLKEALTDAATSFFNAIAKANIENIANSFTNIIGGSFTGNKKSSPKLFASGGMINGGSGTKDDVPAMLMGGEYVVKKSAVKKYGSSFLDSLNQGRLSGYAAGGAVQSGAGGFYAPGEYGQGAITGQRQLLEFATQSRTSGQFDQMDSYGTTGASINLEAESERLTMAGRESNPIFERTQQAKEEAFQVYLQSLQADKQYEEQLKQMREAEKARKKQLLTSIGMAVATTALSAVIRKFEVGGENASAQAAEFADKEGKKLSTWDNVKNYVGGGFKNVGRMFPGGERSTSQLNDYALARRLDMPVDMYRGIQSSRGVQGYSMYRPLGSSSGTYSNGSLVTGGNSPRFGPLKSSINQPFLDDSLTLPSYLRLSTYTGNLGDSDNGPSVNPLLPPPGSANGGPIFGGSGIRDDVPAMLTGGEFVLNNRATRKLGMSNLQRLNSGDTSSQQSSSESSSDLTQALMSKLDELINETKKTSKDNIVVNVSGTDNKTEKNDGTVSANEKDLQKKIKAAVLEVITQEKRLGGSLSK